MASGNQGRRPLYYLARFNDDSVEVCPQCERPKHECQVPTRSIQAETPYEQDEEELRATTETDKNK